MTYFKKKKFPLRRDTFPFIGTPKTRLLEKPLSLKTAFSKIFLDFL
jgi:hypothetical protein